MSVQQTQDFFGVIDIHLRYLLYLPPGYTQDSEGTWPLILFLHGSGERGDDIESVKRHGLARVVEQGVDVPAIVVSPQCPQDTRWNSQALSRLLDDVCARCRVDTARIYVTGLSMGGFGTWALAIAEPERFAAIVPICSGGDPASVCSIGRLPAWVFHGALDPIVPLARSEEMVEALRRCDGDVRFTVYADADHDSWTRTYENPELYTWLLSHNRRMSR